MRRAAAALLAIALAACHHADRAGGHGSASGQILKGSVSDAMLPYDTVKSQAPAAPPERASPDARAPGADSAAAAASEAASAAQSSALPAPSLAVSAASQ